MLVTWFVLWIYQHWIYQVQPICKTCFCAYFICAKAFLFDSSTKAASQQAWNTICVGKDADRWIMDLRYKPLPLPPVALAPKRWTASKTCIKSTVWMRPGKIWHVGGYQFRGDFTYIHFCQLRLQIRSGSYMTDQFRLADANFGHARLVRHNSLQPGLYVCLQIIVRSCMRSQGKRFAVSPLPFVHFGHARLLDHTTHRSLT